ncbi:MAG: hypothetical protein KDD67_04825 [Ignavibacteriae bacterium]|nr:hypothetical protein [Ignavibacteriota bacterium]MCB9216347.1 hypothetical protein [Ignavibacteria bacterium]
MNKPTEFDSPSSRFAVGYYILPILLLLAYRLFLSSYICDDAYISLGTAVHVADGSGFGFNVGEHLYVTTSPLWVMLLAMVRLMVGDVFLAAALLGFLFEAGLLLLLSHLGKVISGSRIVGMLAALLLVVNPVFIVTSMSGMEMALYLCVALLSLHFLLKENYILGLALSALTVWVRFDGVLILASALLWSLYRLRGSLNKRVLLYLIPAIVILLGYLLFGEVVFDTVVPTSTQRKGMSSPALFSSEWLAGAFMTAREFVKVIVGKSGYWITGLSPLILFVPFLGVGLWKLFKERNQKVIPLFLMTAAYVGGYVGSGSSLPIHFSWYFVPMLPFVCFLMAEGLSHAGSYFAQRYSMSSGAWATVVLTLALFWGVGNWFAIDNSKKLLLATTDGELDRERVYAASAYWIGTYLDGGAKVAACEIGTIGFFLPPHVDVIDTYGILRKPDEVERSAIEMVQGYRPEGVLTRDRFRIKDSIEGEMKGAYVWYKFRSLDIGFRSDIAHKIEVNLDDLSHIYNTIKLNQEPY